jgi:hypothetical protein
MADIYPHNFCRVLYREVMKDVRKRFTREEIASAWVYNTGTRTRPSYEFHGPNGHYDYNLRGADCAYSAKAEGWQRLLSKCPECGESEDFHKMSCSKCPC